MIKKIILDETDSTNSYAKRIATFEKEDVLIIAKKQTAGRGRTGKKFFSPDGGIYMSLLLHPGDIPGKTVGITAMAAVAVVRTIQSVFGIIPFIKWVNDIYINNKKVCGILTEGVFNPESGGFDYAVLGVGVNLCMPDGGFPDDIKNIAGAVCDSVSTKQRDLFIESFINEFYDIYSGKRDYMTQYKERSNVLGKMIEYIKDNEIKCGTAVDITDTGELVVREGDNLHKLFSGEIRICVDSIK